MGKSRFYGLPENGTGNEKTRIHLDVISTIRGASSLSPAKVKTSHSQVVLRRGKKPGRAPQLTRSCSPEKGMEIANDTKTRSAIDRERGIGVVAVCRVPGEDAAKKSAK